MKQQNNHKLDKKSEIKLYIVISILLFTIIILDHANVGLPCFF
jgi:nitrate reductase NapE component